MEAMNHARSLLRAATFVIFCFSASAQPPPGASVDVTAPNAGVSPGPSSSPVVPEPSGLAASEPMRFNAAPLVRVDVLMVSVPQERALPLIVELRDPAKSAAAEARLLEMIGRREATLEGWPDITTQSGVRAVSESIVEHRYPIEFHGPKCASCLGLDQAGGQGSPKGAAPTAQEKAAVALLQLAANIPTTFETRNTGTTLEVEPVVSPDGAAVTLSVSPQIVRFERYIEFPAGVNEKGEKITIPQPVFTTSKVSSTVTLRDGERRLLHVGKATEAKTTIDLFIIGAKVSANPLSK